MEDGRTVKEFCNHVIMEYENILRHSVFLLYMYITGIIIGNVVI